MFLDTSRIFWSMFEGFSLPPRVPILRTSGQYSNDSYFSGVCLLAGIIITAVEIIYPHSFSTILEVDYDTPYDRHIIIEDSRGRRAQKKNMNACSRLEEPEVSHQSLGSRILRRLNSRNDEVIEPGKHSAYEKEFYLEPSSWRYPQRKSSENGRRSTPSLRKEGSKYSNHQVPMW
ncbi:unnamed protein product [Acanthoscelides obtectus]|uniref:Uncharacterized protein n=1 Tax=Acanthoscelides obtectus TaxID=200917 RepID=A0A9P0PML3_ACAOB|nr:unnamed protein product [Acanthoscelides obtectus]CAK1653616.1 hypothetical protein AOBTE_LOCUS18305 [Acanthoscelides obtectus]